jgi:hypothetical protein
MSVTEIKAWRGDKVYFVATKVNDPGSRHLYAADINKQGSLLTI